MKQPKKPGKIAFANQLRGVAVMLVIASHYLGTFWGSRDDVANRIFAPSLNGDFPKILHYIWFPTLNYGPLGVGIFFLISGFVIPFSLEKMGSARFMIARIFRIFPTYWVGLAITLLFLWASSRYWGKTFAIDQQQLLANALLINTQFFIPSIDDINWTLSIEMKFYIASVLLWPLIRRGSVFTLINFALAILAFLTWVPYSWGESEWLGHTLSLDLTKNELMFLPFLFIGTLFNMAFRERISNTTLAGAAAAILFIIAMMWQKTPLASQFYATPINYVYALAIFSIFYASRDRFRASRALDFLAEISYPLYVVHCLSGYVVMRYLISHGIRGGNAALAAFALMVMIAYMLHILVEVPTANIGKKIAAWNGTRDSASMAVAAK